MKKIFVLGDIILDSYKVGSVSRVSPEAPVPVVRLQKSKFVLGGAANVAANISSLDGSVVLFGVLGNDASGSVVKELLKEHNIENALLTPLDVFTNTKTRIVGNNQQIARIDENDEVELSDYLQKEIILSIKTRIDECGLLVISDYAKGVCTPKVCNAVIDIAMANNIFVIVDPKVSFWEKYKGASLITPNVKEVSDFLHKSITNDDKTIEKVCEDFIKLNICDSLLITRSEKGMTLVDCKLGDTKHYRAIAREVYDVSGAGDTVVAAIANYISENMDLDSAIKMANMAAGIVVQKKGTATVTKKEIEEQLNVYNRNRLIINNRDQLIEIVENWKENGEKIVFTNGCFDIVHIGHASLFEKASQLGERLIVAINSDDSVKRLKGANRPINNQNDRAYLLSRFKGVDLVTIFEEDTPFELLKIIRPDVLVKGADYSVENVIGKEFAKEVVVVDFISGYSTTNTINKLNSGKEKKECK